MESSHYAARVLSVLPLRRRCLFMLDEDFFQAHFFSASGNRNAARCSAVQQLLTEQLQQLRCCSAAEAAVTAVQLMHSAFDNMVSSAAPVVDGLGTIASPRKGGPAPLYQWQTGIDGLLLYLEQQGSDGATTPPPADSAANVVRQTLYRLIAELYNAAVLFFQQRSHRKRRRAISKPCGRERENDERGNDAERGGTASRSRLTWSIAAPISALFCAAYRASGAAEKPSEDE